MKEVKTPHKKKERAWLSPQVLSIVLLGIIAVGVWVFFYFTGLDKQEELESTQNTKEAIEEPAKDVSDRTLALCSRGDDVARALHRAGVCRRSEDVKEVIDRQPEVIEGPRGERGPGPTQEQINSAVRDYLRENPPQNGRTPTPAEVAQAVANYLQENPPEPGRPPSEEEIRSAVTAYCSEDNCVGPQGETGKTGEKGEKGEKGDKGDPGRPPLPEEIAGAVEAFCRESGMCQGPRGEPPAKWTWTDPGPTPSDIDDVTYTCSRSNEDDNAPTYSCTPQEGESSAN